MRFQFLYILSSTCYCLYFFIAILVSYEILSRVSICIYLLTSDTQHHFMYLLAIFISSFFEVFIQISCSFLIEYILFFISQISTWVFIFSISPMKFSIFLKICFKDQFEVHSEIKERYRDFPYISCHMHRLPHHQHPRQQGTFVTTDELKLIRQYLQSP